jgi:hypothetical protein
VAIAHSTGLKAYDLNSGFKSAFDTTGVIRIYSGTAPGPDNAVTGTLLSTLTLAATSFSVSGGVATAGAIASDTSAAATGTAGYFRVSLSGDATGASTTLRRLEGTVGTSGADLNLNNTSITSGGTVSISSFSYTHPA